MVNVWLIHEGDLPEDDNIYCTLSISECVAKLELKHSDWKAELKKPPRIERKKADNVLYGNVDGVTGPICVVVGIDGYEANSEWRSGFYLLSIIVDDAAKRLSSSPGK